MADGRKRSHRWDYQSIAEARRPEGVGCQRFGCSVRLRKVMGYELFSTDGGKTWSRDYAGCSGGASLAPLRKAAHEAGVRCVTCAHLDLHGVEDVPYCHGTENIMWANGAVIDIATHFCAAYEPLSSTRDTAVPIHAASPAAVSTRLGRRECPQSSPSAVSLVVGSNEPQKGAR